MNSPIVGLRVAGTLFGLFCFFHVWRLLVGMPVMFGRQSIPLSASVVAMIIAGGLSVWMWMLSSGKS